MNKKKLFEITANAKIACVVLAGTAKQALSYFNSLDAETLMGMDSAREVLDFSDVEVFEARDIPKAYIGNEADIMRDLAHLKAPEESPESPS